MPTGPIRKLVTERGFGFIKADGNEQDVFFHHLCVTNRQFDELADGQLVDYEIEEQGPKKGPRASVVRPIWREKRNAA